MRVLYSFPDRLGKPGIGTTAFHQVEGVAAEGVEVSLYCTSLDRRPAGVETIVETMALGGVRVPHRVAGVERSYRYHDWRVARALQRLRGEIDLVHCWPKAALQTCNAARALGIKSFREVPNTHTGFAFARVAAELEKLGLEPSPGHSHTFDERALAREESEYRAADFLLVPSEFSKLTFRDRGFPEKRLILHQYGFDPARFSPDRAASRGTDEPLTALFAGRCEPRKGLHHALRAWFDSGVAARGRLIICGEFAPGYRSALADGLDHPSVDVLGFVPDLGEIMRQSDVLLLPSIEEGSALVTYEAQACGCVLIVSDAAGARCEHLRNALVHGAGDVAALTEHIRLVDRDRDLLLRLRAGTLEMAPQLTWAQAAEKLVAAYAGCLRQLNRPGRPSGPRARIQGEDL